MLNYIYIYITGWDEVYFDCCIVKIVVANVINIEPTVEYVYFFIIFSIFLPLAILSSFNNILQFSEYNILSPSNLGGDFNNGFIPLGFWSSLSF